MLYSMVRKHYISMSNICYFCIFSEVINAPQRKVCSPCDVTVLVSRDYPRETEAFTCLAIIFGWIASALLHPGSSAQQRCQYSSRIIASTGAGRATCLPAIECLTLGLSRGMNGASLILFDSSIAELC